MNLLSVLVADDEEEIRSLLVLWLTTAGHAVSSVANASEARGLLGQQRFDLLVTDVLMPDGDGIQLIKELKEKQPSARVLAISGGGRYMETDNCLKIAKGLGANSALIKPFNREQFFEGMGLALGAAPSSPA